MRGLELAKAYYEAYGMPMLKNSFPALWPRLAAGLAGDGSECLGFDDEISRDHDFGPGFCIWLTAQDYERYGDALSRAYEELPKAFGDFPARSVTQGGGGRVGVMSVPGFYSRFIGNEQPPVSLERWLFLPEDKLAAVTAGEVFYDGAGEFTRLRSALLAYYPEDVRIKKIAARAAAMAQSGQYNYARCMRRGDRVAAQIAMASFVKTAMSMWYLLEKKYAPYYKWMYKGLRHAAMSGKTTEVPAQRLRRITDLIGELALCPDQSAAWPGRLPDGTDPYENRLDQKVSLAEDICELTRDELARQGLSDLEESFLERHAWEIMKRIKDPQLKGMHVMAG